jgi:4a-hydroxytetrahydrobiopterin dehydratase
VNRPCNSLQAHDPARNAGLFYSWGMSTDLAEKRCKPCEGGVEPLLQEQVDDLMKGLHDDWTLSDDGLEISRRFSFPAYSRTVAFANAVAWIAIVESHHPVLTVSYGDCVVSYTTHAINGLSDNDFICAAKIDRLAANAE